MEMDERKKKILLAVVQDYIFSAEPVGSRSISKKHDLGVSPATIRNDMSDLEELGYIEQPHTSAGRVPSELGYRYYVDSLMESYRLDRTIKNTINKELVSKSKELANVIKNTCDLLSSITNYTAMVMAPSLSGNRCKHVQLVPVELGKALVVIVGEGGVIQNRLIEVPENISYQELNQISEVINAKLQGKTIEQIRRTLIKEIYFELTKHQKIAEVALELLQGSGITNSEEKRLYLAGTLNMFNQPEFRDIEKIKTLMGLLDQEHMLKQLMAPQVEEQGVKVKIGAEMKLPGFNDCSMITATYHIDGRMVGSIGVLGPTRMEYDRVVSLVDYINLQLNQILNEHFSNKK